MDQMLKYIEELRELENREPSVSYNEAANRWAGKTGTLVLALNHLINENSGLPHYPLLQQPSEILEAVINKVRALEPTSTP